MFIHSAKEVGSVCFVTANAKGGRKTDRLGLAAMLYARIPWAVDRGERGPLRDGLAISRRWERGGCEAARAAGTREELVNKRSPHHQTRNLKGRALGPFSGSRGISKPHLRKGGPAEGVWQVCGPSQAEGARKECPTERLSRKVSGRGHGTAGTGREQIQLDRREEPCRSGSIGHRNTGRMRGCGARQGDRYRPIQFETADLLVREILSRFLSKLRDRRGGGALRRGLNGMPDEGGSGLKTPDRREGLAKGMGNGAGTTWLDPVAVGAS